MALKIVKTQTKSNRKRNNNVDDITDNFTENFNKYLKIEEVNNNSNSSIDSAINNKIIKYVPPPKIVITYPKTGVEEIQQILGSINNSPAITDSSEHTKIILSTLGRLIIRVNNIEDKYKHLSTSYENILLENNELKKRISHIETTFGINPILRNTKLKRYNNDCSRYKTYDNLADLSDDSSDDEDNIVNDKKNGNKNGKKSGNELDNPMLNNISYCV